MPKLFKNPRSKGFTLIELIIAVVIMGILATIVLASYTQVRKSSRDTQRKSDLQTVANVLQRFYSDRSSYPLSSGGRIRYFQTNCTTTGTVVTATWGSSSITCGGETYIKQLPKDPLSATAEYCYTNPSPDTQRFEIYARLEGSGNVNPSVSCAGVSGYNYRVTSRD